MFSRAAQNVVVPHTQVRGMATLKEIRLRLKSVSNIKKITSSMKMVSAAKYTRAERELRPARSYGAGASAFYEKIEAAPGEEAKDKLIVALTSDKGLCGGVHSSICRTIRNIMYEKGADKNIKLFLIGDKSNQILTRLFAKDVLTVCKNLGKKPPNFNDASFLAQQIIKAGFNYDVGTVFFNTFKSVVSYQSTQLPIFTESDITSAPKLYDYDSVDQSTIQCYNEFMLASRMYFAMKESACSEQSARMTAMDAASKNADEMIVKLNLTYNRTRQAYITRELIEIISGAEAL
ncbi:ATPG-like protein [Mya arenaria]|uniref:ATP synthase subunit gamma n=1 Tax=Mya arenaria TaxID=6604 RepID=A0ABY7FW14_MYAAR|nr:ATP synthase subunit gamma, mitochondrial-like [Mya arenaria]WAR25469.1 ATPG-like protein [Mya arenaria]